jgi:hypothetical protein
MKEVVCVLWGDLGEETDVYSALWVIVKGEVDITLLVKLFYDMGYFCMVLIKLFIKTFCLWID